MTYATHYTSPKTKTPSLFFLTAVTGLTVVIFFLTRPTPIVAAPVVPQEPISQEPISSILPVTTITPKAIQKIAQAHLIIPKIKVNAVIDDMGLTPTGAMAVPDSRVDVGWFSLGTRPGEIGSAVIAGHNVWDSGTGVFIDLDQLEKGDIVSVVDAKGAMISFAVREMRTFDATDTNSGIFASQSGIHLNLITCSGVWNPATGSYTTRLVVFTDLIPTAN